VRAHAPSVSGSTFQFQTHAHGAARTVRRRRTHLDGQGCRPGARRRAHDLVASYARPMWAFRAKWNDRPRWFVPRSKRHDPIAPIYSSTLPAIVFHSGGARLGCRHKKRQLLKT
jgi:hypothetical protein